MLNRTNTLAHPEPPAETAAERFAAQPVSVRLFCLGCLLLASAQMAVMIVVGIAHPF